MDVDDGDREMKTEGTLHNEKTSNAQSSDASADPRFDEDLSDDIPLSFPQKLMEILNKPEHNEVISWLPHGKGFIIYKKKKFASELLPKYFKQAKFTSFTRKLNRWGFTRITRGPETGAYYHKFFVRDEPRLCLQMSCQNIRHYQEQMALEQQQRHQHEVALAATGGLIPGLLPGSGLGAMGGLGGLGLSNLNMNEVPLLQQQALQRLQLEQLQKQQEQLQANELVRRAMATQASAAAAQSQLAAMTKTLLQQQQQNDSQHSTTSGLTTTQQTGSTPSDLYMQLLHAKASQVTARPLMTAIQNSLRTAPPNVLVGAPSLAQSAARTPLVRRSDSGGSGSSDKRGSIRRASAA